MSAEEPPASNLPAEPVVILVAEDNLINQKVMLLLLDTFGISADTANNGQAAIEAFKTKSYELILMDLQMPVMDGFDATKEIRKLEFNGGTHIPIIACTAMDLAQAKERCLTAGIDDFLSKPISRQELQMTLERWMKIPLQKVLNRLRAEIKSATDGTPINRKRIKLLYDTDQIDDILKLFLTVTESSLHDLKSMISDKDVQATWPLAHELKAASYAVSAEETSVLCQQLEQSAQREDWAEAQKIYSSLNTAFERVKEFLESKTTSQVTEGAQERV